MLRKIISGVLATMLVAGTMMCTNASAAIYDTGALGAGYYVDLDAYKPVKWYNRVVSRLYFNGIMVGSSATDIGITRAKNRSSDSYVDCILTRNTMKGHGYNKTYGYANYLRMYSCVNGNQTLWGYAPKTTASNSSYNIGLNLGGSVNTNGSGGLSMGISASHTFTQNALTIKNHSDSIAGKVDIEFVYGDAFWRWDWSIFDTYSYEESIQLFSYEIRTSSSEYKCKLIKELQYQIYNSTPGWFSSPTKNTTTLNHTINFTSLY